MFRFLATGDSFKTIGESFRLGYSTIQEIIHTTCAVIWEVLSKLVMREPIEETWKKISEALQNKWNFSNWLRALDGKHIKIQAPDKSESLFYKYKKKFIRTDGWRRLYVWVTLAKTVMVVYFPAVN